jgi:choline dehydrogenase-like flavoprotein
VVLAGPDTPPEGEVEGDPYPPLSTTRAGGVGGSAALWYAELAPGIFGARYAPLAPIDFEERPGILTSGWPFGREVLDPFYARAQQFCSAGPFDYEPRSPVFASETLAGGVFRFGPATAVMERHRQATSRSTRLTVLAPATATRLRTADNGKAVDSVEVRATPQRSFQIGARAYVLAAGGVENARLLLISGIGNEDVVGRCFMDHPTIRCRLELVDRSADLRFFDAQRLDGHPVLGCLELSAATLRSEQLLNGGFFIVPARERALRAAAAARSLADAARKRRVPPQPLRAAAQIALGFDVLAYAAHRRLARMVPALETTVRLWPRSRLLNTLGLGPITGWSTLRRRERVYDVYHVIEQSPDRERRVTLGATRDAFGLPVARLRWFLGARELESAERAEEILRDELARLGVGRLTTGRELAGGDLVPAVHPTVHHHLGTTRMHGDSRQGVVDGNARVHGVRNLFVAGGSVFPTSGFVNPTLTIVALALRLSAHLHHDVMR